MKSIKKIIQWLSIAFYFAAYYTALAGDSVGGTSGNIGGSAPSQTLQNPITPTTIGGLLDTILGVVVQLTIPVAVILIIYSGFLFLVAQGKPTEISKASKTLMWTVVGTVVILGASYIATIIQSTINQIVK